MNLFKKFTRIYCDYDMRLEFKEFDLYKMLVADDPSLNGACVRFVRDRQVLFEVDCKLKTNLITSLGRLNIKITTDVNST